MTLRSASRGDDRIGKLQGAHLQGLEESSGSLAAAGSKKASATPGQLVIFIRTAQEPSALRHLLRALWREEVAQGDSRLGSWPHLISSLQATENPRWPVRLLQACVTQKVTFQNGRRSAGLPSQCLRDMERRSHAGGQPGQRVSKYRVKQSASVGAACCVLVARRA